MKNCLRNYENCKLTRQLIVSVPKNGSSDACTGVDGGTLKARAYGHLRKIGKVDCSDSDIHDVVGARNITERGRISDRNAC